MIVPGDPLPAGTGLSLGDDSTLLIFFKASCGTCQIGMPVFQHWSRQVRVLGVAQDDATTATAFLDEYGIEMEVVVDAPDFGASRAFDPDGVPAMYLIENDAITWAGTGWNLDQAKDLAGRIATIHGTEPVLVGADGLPPFRPG